MHGHAIVWIGAHDRGSVGTTGDAQRHVLFAANTFLHGCDCDDFDDFDDFFGGESTHFCTL